MRQSVRGRAYTIQACVCFRNCRLSSTPSRRGWTNRTTTMPTTPTTRATTSTICRCTSPSALLPTRCTVCENTVINMKIAILLAWHKLGSARTPLSFNASSTECTFENRSAFEDARRCYGHTRITRLRARRNIIHILRRSGLQSVFREEQISVRRENTFHAV